MAKTFSFTDLSTGTVEERLRNYADALADGQSVRLIDVIAELDMNSSPAHCAAKRAGLCFLAFIPGLKGGANTMIANPKTVKAWHAAQQKLPPPRKSRSSN